MKTVKTDSQQLVNILTECVKKSFGLNENRSINSQIIFDMIKKHGKPRAYGFDLQSLNDDDILVVIDDDTALRKSK